MKKKIIAILATLALACAIGGCADFKDSKDSQSTTQSNGTETSQGGVSEQPETSEGLGESETPETSENGTASERIFRQYGIDRERGFLSSISAA